MTWFSGGEEGGSCRQKSTNEAFRKLIPVNTGVGSEDFGLSQGFQGERRGGAVVAKRVKRGYYRKSIPVNTGVGGGGSEDFGLSHSFHGERKGITFWQKNTKGSSCSFSEQLLVFEPWSLSANKQSPS